ncbi:hypothetical protein [Pseudonocardia sp. MH-G8]|uniref:hypothetical protein n=1 Tax=Pseudonocardia sp. MH-G8 TaxID=1854588 RepID=UPI0018E9E653|nr:hypothetical protein [Pseudonocardia sp. MH-G8]
MTSRRRLLGWAGLGLLAGCGTGTVPVPRPGPRGSAPPADGALGMNVNGDPGSLTLAEMDAVSASWLRAFLPMTGADGALADQSSLRMILAAADQGRRTVLSLQYPYARRPVPVPGSDAFEREVQRLDGLLARVLGEIDILVVGNEPFLETREEDRDSGRMNTFYEALARHVIADRDARLGPAGRTRLYLGALNHLDRPGGRSAAADRWMTFTRDTPGLDGIDVHPHLGSPQDGRHFLDYVLPRLRTDQKFMVTEFSLVHLWKRHLGDRVAPQFADRYGVPRGARVWEVVRSAVDRPFPQQQWDDFLRSNPWFARNGDYLRRQVEAFRGTGRLAVATYAAVQGAAAAREFGPDSMPWLLNSLFCPLTVQPDADGLLGRNTTWTDAFRALQL